MKRPRLPAVCAAALVAAATAAGAQSTASDRGTGTDGPPVFRVEVIAFEHVGGASDRRRSAEPLDFGDHADPVLIAQAHTFAEAAIEPLRTRLPMLPRPGSAGATTPYLQRDGETLRPVPPVYAALGALPPAMARARDRLAASPQHRPLATRAWIQPARPGASAPALRLHDDVVIATRPPARRGTPPFFPSGLRIPLSIDQADARIRQRRLFRPDPPPLALYRLDGTLSLRRRQFLHVDLDLVWQQRGDRIDPAGRQEDPRWLTHRMRQSRVVEPGRMEYFDSGRFGVLVRVTRFERVVPDPEPVPRGDGEDAAPSATADAG